MNRQARFFAPYPFKDMGNMTHEKAARVFAKRHGSDEVSEWSVQTREAPTSSNPDPVVFTHRVTRRVVYDVVSLRGDSDE